jgi:hypothetical protein
MMAHDPKCSCSFCNALCPVAWYVWSVGGGQLVATGGPKGDEVMAKYVGSTATLDRIGDAS